MKVTPGGPAQAQQAQPPQQQQGQQGPSPEDIIKMITTGFSALGQLLQKSGSSLPPSDIKLYQAASQATDAMIQSLTSAPQNDTDEQEAPTPGGAMEANQSANSRPAGPQGR